MGRQTLIFVRHLETKFNRDGVLMGRKYDEPIIRDLQIAKFSKNLHNLKEKFNIKGDSCLIVSSPLLRCLETSDLIKKKLHVKENTTVSPLIIETDTGYFTGKKRNNLKKQYGTLIDKWMFRPSEFTFPNGESYKEVRNRTTEFFNKLIKNKSFKINSTIFVCTHVDIIKMALLIIQKRSFDERRSFDIKNGSFSVVEFVQESNRKKFELVKVNIFSE